MFVYTISDIFGLFFAAILILAVAWVFVSRLFFAALDAFDRWRRKAVKR